MPTIALVDDDRNILTSVSIALESEGFEVRTYSDGATALTALNQTPPDVAVFDQRLLIERIRAVLRRREAQTDTGERAEKDKVMVRGKLTMDPMRHACSWGGDQVTLTVTEFLILQALATRPGFVKSRDALMDAAYDDQVYVDDRTIDSHIKRIRKKFRAVSDDFNGIETLYGVGYRFREG